MRKQSNHKFIKQLIAVALSVAIIGIGFGHRASDVQNDTALEAYILNGGSIWDICGDPSDTNDHSHSSCEACRLVETVHLATQTCVPERQNLIGARLVRIHLPVQRHILSVQSLNPARAPPIHL